jgi:hypothetical protein
MIHDRREQGRHGADERRFRALDLSDQTARVARVGDEHDRIVIDDREALHAGIAVRVEQWQRAHDGIGPLVHRRLKPGLKLPAGGDHAPMHTHHAFRRARRTAAHQDHGGIVGGDAHVGPRGAAVTAE